MKIAKELRAENPRVREVDMVATAILTYLDEQEKEPHCSCKEEFLRILDKVALEPIDTSSFNPAKAPSVFSLVMAHDRAYNVEQRFITDVKHEMKK